MLVFGYFELYGKKYEWRRIMGKQLDTIPASDLGQSADEIVKQVIHSQKPLIITQRGQAAAVLLDIESYEKSERDKEILRLLARGEKEIAIGEGYDLDTILAEADSLLSQEPS
jgi:prevent-host-death family protein